MLFARQRDRCARHLPGGGKLLPPAHPRMHCKGCDVFQDGGIRVKAYNENISRV